MKLKLPTFTDSQYETIIYVCIAIGLIAVTYYVLVLLQEWYEDRKYLKDVEAWRQQQQVNVYIEALRLKNLQLEDDIRDARGKELSYLDERKVTNNRMKLMAREIACLDDKKTLVLGQNCEAE